MNWALLRHIAWALFTTLFCVCAALFVAHFLSYRIPAGLDEAFVLKGLFFIALIAALIYIPAIQATHARVARRLIRSIIGIVGFSAAVAVLSSTGGGTVRRLITNDATIFSSPLHVWWQAVFYGWALGLLACGLRLNIYQRSRFAKTALDNIDAWIMGVFAVAGAMAARGWRPLGDISDNIFVQMFYSQ